MQSETLSAALRQSGFENLTFSTPWSARLFGMTLAASEKGFFTLQQFQSALIGRISEKERFGCINTDDDYYTCWLEALQGLLEEKNLWQVHQLREREVEVVEAAEHRKEYQRQGQYTVQPEVVK
ncbi:nitrile hydratase accessory protein [Marinobacter sp. HL-58]|uniref:nitrile hydratase accessory protein n=1 Tax=Marinobacter sp. HL-58 TaxID=1479237 RepID=UPI0006919ABC|nr:nitrile hydratase accessory protein [Marinobacter sp. HL-58]KPQ01533.1 MAG: nitrile hydratase accessory component [Marinobacter sp. HL-58]